jgi:heptosyltransferase II
MGAAEIKRVVVRGTNWVGDCVMTVPALRALRKVLPDAEITLAIKPGVKGIFAGADFIDNILIYDRRNILSVVPQIRELRKRHFDLALLFQNAFEAALIPFMAGVPLRLGYATESRQPMLSHPISIPDWRNSRHEVFYYLYLVAALEQMLFGTSSVCDTDPEAEITVSETQHAAALEILRSVDVSPEDKVVVICPGSINSRAKRWPVDSFAALADKLIESKRKVLLIGSKDEVDVTQAVVRKMKQQPVVLTGKTNLEEILGVIDSAQLVVTNDTGPAHIAAALGRPTLVIFGPTNPDTTRPFAPQAELLRHPPDCAPCMLRDCPIDHRCMTAITVDEVFERSHAILKRGSFANTVRSVCDSVA